MSNTKDKHYELRLPSSSLKEKYYEFKFVVNTETWQSPPENAKNMQNGNLSLIVK